MFEVHSTYGYIFLPLFKNIETLLKTLQRNILEKSITVAFKSVDIANCLRLHARTFIHTNCGGGVRWNSLW